MSLLRVEHGGALGVLLMIYTLQIYMGNEETSGYTVDIWIDNKDVIARGEKARMGSDLKAHLVLDYNLWKVMNML